MTHMGYRRSNGSVCYRRTAKLETLQAADRLVCKIPGPHSRVLKVQVLGVQCSTFRGTRILRNVGNYSPSLTA
jgi:hypothetical protein